MLQQNIIIIIIGSLIAIALIYYKKKQVETQPQKSDNSKKPQKLDKQQYQSPIKNLYQDQLIQRNCNGTQKIVSSSKIRSKTPSPIKQQIKPIVTKNNQINSNQIIKQQQQQKIQSQIIVPVIPNSQITFQANQPTVKQVIFDLYNKSCNKRSSGGNIKFIGPAIFGQCFISDFMLEGTQIANSLYTKIKGYRRVRGDGNCYYTAIAFQYLRILLTKCTDNQFQQILNNIEEMNLMVYYTNFMLQPNMQNQLAKALVELLQVLRFDSQSLEQVMSDPNQEFYGLAIIFLKNLANNLYVQDSQIRNIYQPDLSGEILTWEYQCNNTEMLNSALSKYLKVNIKVYFIDRMNDELIVFSYGEESWHKIHLLFEPGHYDIGIVQQDEH